jgi:hypothetical protein
MNPSRKEVSIMTRFSLSLAVILLLGIQTGVRARMISVVPGKGVAAIGDAASTGAGSAGAASNLGGLSLPVSGAVFRLNTVLPSVETPVFRAACAQSAPSAAARNSAEAAQAVSAAVEAETLIKKGMSRAGALSIIVADETRTHKRRGKPDSNAAYSRMFDNGHPGKSQIAAVSVSVAPGVSRNGLNSRRKLSSLNHPSDLPEPEGFGFTPGQRRTGPALGNKIWTAVKTIAALGFGLYGGMQGGDIAYALILAKLGLAGLGVGLASVAAAAYFLRRRAVSGGKRSVLWSTLLGMFTFSATGQLLWDATGSAAIGMGAGAVLALVSALAAYGLFAGSAARSKK